MNPNKVFTDAVRAHQSRDLVRARLLYETVAASHPVPEVLEQLGAVNAELGDLRSAENIWKRMLWATGEYAHTYRIHGHLCWVYAQLEKPALSIEHGQTSVRLNPRFEGGWMNLAGALERAERYEEALRAYEQLSALGSTLHLETYYALKRLICDWEGIEKIEARLKASARKPALLFNYFGTVITSADEQLAFGKDRSAGFGLPHWFAIGSKHRVTGRKIRLGYLSNDFHNTPTMLLLTRVLELHDRERFELHAFSFGPDYDVPMRHRLKRAFDQFHDVRNVKSSAVAGLITSNRIDILIDLCGYLRDNRIDILAMRPAPIQVGFLGWPATTGAPFLDHIIADPIVAPDVSKFSEHVIHLGCYLPTDDSRRDPEPTPRAKLGLPEDAIVLASMNNQWKVTPEIMGLWCKVLRKVPDAVLWQVVRNRTAESNLQAFARRCGVEDRVIFVPDASYEAHLNRLCAADLGLDTHPYGGHTTTADLLWAGVPVVTCRGSAFMSRVASSALTAVDLAGLSTDSFEEYEALIVSLCNNRPRLIELKAKLNAGRRSSRLFDSRAFTQEFEAKLVELVT